MQAENGYHLYDFRGAPLREDPIEQFKQFAWRPRPPTLLSKDEVKKTRKNLREFSKIFDEQDFNKKNLANRAVVEQRRRLLDEWVAWRKSIETYFEDEEIEINDTKDDDGEGEVIEEIVEEIIDETEEILP